MTFEEIENKYKSICDLVAEKQIKDALGHLEDFVNAGTKEDYRIQLENYKETYQNILKHSFKNIQDPERQKIYNSLLCSILKLTDIVKQNILENNTNLSVYKMKKDLGIKTTLSREEGISMIEELSFDPEWSAMLENNVDIDEDKFIEENLIRQTAVFKVFNHIWLTDKYQEASIALVRKINTIKDFPWYEKCLLVSALTLSLLRCFDVDKVVLLFEFFEKSEEQVWQRALVGLVLGLYVYDKRLSFYPEINEKLKKHQNNKDIERNIEAILIQIIKSRETEKISQKLKDEIIPEMIKFKPRLEDKLDLDSLLSEKFMEDKNPEWETFFQDSPDLFDKLEEFSMLQMEGSDVFLSAFAMLKQFDFFREIGNWFLPFYSSNVTVRDTMKGEKENIDTKMFIEGLEKSAFLCNSDKYSFCLNIKHMPALQKSMMMELFNLEVKGMNEIAREDETINQFAKTKNIYIQYLQDLYRFYKLHPLKNEFNDIFGMKLNIYKTGFFNTLISNRIVLRNIAEFYFEKNYYDEALEIFMILKQEQESSPEIYEKIGYCYQLMKNYDKALEFYLKAELFDTVKAWTLKKIALCYRYLKQPEKALNYYLEAEKIEPENLYIQASLGHCYLDIKDYEKAIKYYFKVEYLEPKNNKVLRPIAWCSFVLGKFDVAKKYFKKSIEKQGNKYDLMNLGHVEWCIGNLDKTIEYYKKSIMAEENNLEWFIDCFNDDTQYLESHGIDPLDMPLMLDYLKYSLK